MRHPEPTHQRLIWIPEGETLPGRSAAAKQVPDQPWPYTQRPERFWNLQGHRDPAAPPALPYWPTHHVNAFLEDEGHDYKILKRGTLHISSHSSDGGHWALLEFVKRPYTRRTKPAADGGVK
jgi:hypothetical protein